MLKNDSYACEILPEMCTSNPEDTTEVSATFDEGVFRGGTSTEWLKYLFRDISMASTHPSSSS